MKVCLCLLLMASFTARCGNDKSSHSRHRQRTHSATTKKTSPPLVISGNETGILVSAGWMQKYKVFEAKHGTIPEDEMIYMEGDLYRIPIQTADHFNDMVRAEPTGKKN